MMGKTARSSRRQSSAGRTRPRRVSKTRRATAEGTLMSWRRSSQVSRLGSQPTTLTPASKPVGGRGVSSPPAFSYLRWWVQEASASGLLELSGICRQHQTEQLASWLRQQRVFPVRRERRWMPSPTFGKHRHGNPRVREPWQWFGGRFSTATVIPVVSFP